MQILIIILGCIILCFGRRLFWLYAATLGFLVGLELIKLLLPDQPAWALLVGGLAVGMLGAVLAVFFQRVAFAIAGFFAGAYLGLMVVHTAVMGGNSIIGFAVGGLIGAVVALVLMNWAIIVFSSFVGAGAIVTQLPSGQKVSAIVFVILVVIGITVQARLMKRSRESEA
jgi:hypothetical protein